MKTLSVLLIILSFVISVPLVLADEGMWTFDNPPFAQWKERYNFEPTQEWLDHIRLASVKVEGASGSFVSADGLIITNHHVASGQLAKLSTKENNLIKNGFYARTQAEELKTPDMEVNMLVSFEDVTERVLSAVKPGATDKEASEQRRAVITQIEKESTEKTGLKSDVISFYNGGEYWLYRNKKYTDVRVVFAPEEQIAFFGGDYDNFTYPRYCLDITFLRVYEDGKPAKIDHFLKWSENGPKDGEFVIASGYPGSTARLLTVTQLGYQRDVGNPLLEHLWTSRKAALEDYAKLGAEQERQSNGAIRSLSNSMKRLTGQQDGLMNERMFAKKVKEEKDLKEGLKKFPALEKEYGPAWDQISEAYAHLPPYAKRIAFSSLSPSRLGSIALSLVRYHEEIKKPGNLRYPEFSDTRIESFKSNLLSTAPIYPEMEKAVLTGWLEEGVKTLGVNDPFIKAAIGEAEVSEVVNRAVNETELKDVAARQALLEGGPAAIANSTDPMITLARRVEPVIRELRAWNEDKIQNVEARAGEKIAKARFAVYGRTIPPDANSNLRVTYGKVKGYEEDTTLVPFKTTFYGLFDRAEGFGESFPFTLPPRYREGRNKVNLSTPFNFAYSADTIGGMSGSPVINRDAEFTGINFDSNIQKLSNRYWYIEEDEGSRAVAVHSAGILEALRNLYGAGDLARELTGK